MSLIRSITCVVLFLFASSASAAALEVVVQVKGKHHPEVALVEAVPDSAGAKSVQLEALLVEGSGSVTLEADEPVSWRLRASATGFWSLDVIVDSSTQESALLKLWPAATVMTLLKASAWF